MNLDPYEALVASELARMRMEPRPAGTIQPADEPAPARAWGWIAVTLVLAVAPALYLSPLAAAGVIGAILLMSFVMTHGRARGRWLARLRPSDRPRITAVVRPPERLFCPRCGAEKTQDYCAGCGAHIEREYRKIARSLVRYIVEDTDSQRAYLEAQMQEQLREVAERHKRAIEAALASMEERCIAEIIRQRRTIADLRAQLAYLRRQGA